MANQSSSPAFLRDLSETYNRIPPQLASPAFVSELKEVYDSLARASESDLEFLAERFEKWRGFMQERLGSLLRDLPLDDPLKCPISLFRTMEYGRLETAHTRTLAWLLDPKGEHGFADALLRALLRHLAENQQIDGVVVGEIASECAIDNSDHQKGRLDVLARGSCEENGQPVRWLLVIEAKVDAWEGEGQLAKYEHWLRKEANGRRVLRVFLTPGARPAESGFEEWQPLSYLDLVRIFRKPYGQLSEAPGFHFLRFYLAGVLQDICHFRRDVNASVADPYTVVSYLKTVHH
jgi:hypothetical protein